jgi:hypothetical protein
MIAENLCFLVTSGRQTIFKGCYGGVIQKVMVLLTPGGKNLYLLFASDGRPSDMLYVGYGPATEVVDLEGVASSR